MKKILRPRNLVLLAGLALLGFVATQPHLRQALIHQQADLDDYTIFANREVKTGRYQPWKRATDYNRRTVAPALAARMRALQTVAFVVAQRDSLCHEQYWEGYADSSLSNSFSMAKSVVSLLVGVAIDERKIKGVNQRVGDFLPEFATGNNAALTIKDLLTMSSGLNWDESYANPLSMTTKAYYGNDVNATVRDLRVVEKPGVVHKYLSGNTQLLAMVLEKATGWKLSDYASEKLWQPLGARHPAQWSLDRPNGQEKAYCCFNSNAQDFARLGQLVLQRGVWNGQPLVSAAYVDAATAPATHLRDGSSTGQPVDYYGYQFWVVQYKGMRIPYFRGILGQYIFVIPAKDAVVVRLGKNRSETENHHPKDIFVYLDAALAMLE